MISYLVSDKYSVSGKTRVCGVIGDPIGHSLSPVIQNAAFKARRLDYVYHAFQVKKEALGEAIREMREHAIAGLNVTIPHKVAVMKYLDKLDPLAEKIGAVNTIVNKDGVLSGYNTDAVGFLEPLLKIGAELEGKKAVILGAGGAARAISFVLAEKGAELYILNRTVEKAGALAVRIKEKTGKDAVSLELNPENLKEALTQTDIVVNTTSLGMSPNVAETPLPDGLIRGGMLVYDIVYNPMETRLLREARAAGAETIAGMDMLVYQGAKAFELWTGVKAPVGVMRRELARALKEREK